MTVSQKAYDAGTAAVLVLIRKNVADIMPQVPFPFRGMIPVDKEPDWAKHIAKIVLDAADAAEKGS
jgi:hypothetical protein